MGGKYLGAGFSGTVDWDDSTYFVRSDSDLLAAMHNAVKDTAFEKYQATFDQLALKGICINPSVPDTYGKIGNTRFGGLPDLPVGVDYPTQDGPYKNKGYEHLSFFAQLNCAELAPYQNYLPRTGLLYFFVTEEDEYHSDVWYHPSTEGLITAMTLKGMDFNNAYLSEPYTPYKAEFRKLIALPAYFDNKPFNDHELETFASSQMSKAAFSESLGRKGILRKHNNVYYQDMNHSINDSVHSTSGDSPVELAANSRGGKPEDWMVLLRLYSDNKCNFQFYDAGELYFVIHKSDLAKKDFSNVFSFADSS